MIQRIQSVYLLLGAAACGLPYLAQFAQLEAGAPPWVSTLRGLLFVLTAVLGLVAIFLYSNRVRQQSVVFWAQIVAAVCLIVAVGSLILYGTSGPGIQSLTGSTDAVLTALAPILAVVLYQLARRGIVADVKLVKSMDRLRG